MNILFVHTINPLSEEETRYPPIWPAYLSAYISKHLPQLGIEYKVVSTDIQKHIESFHPDIVAISTVSQNYNRAKHIAHIAKCHSLPVVIGGYHITAIPRSLSDDMDVGCVGEGEETFRELIIHLLNYGCFNKKHLCEIDGIVFKDDGEVIITSPRMLISDLNTLPHPNRSIIGYPERNYMVTSRGCPNQCIFCSCTRFWNKKFRTTSAEYVFDEVEELIRNGAKIIRFNDDILTLNKHKMHALADMIINKGYHKKIKFSCWAHAATIDNEMADILKSMNMVSVVMGLESGNDRVLKYLKGNNSSVEYNKNAIQMLKSRKIQANGDFIIGAPDETEQEIMDTYHFIKDNPVDFAQINVLMPFPNSPLWDYALQKGLVSDDINWEKINFQDFQFQENMAVVLSETMNREKLAYYYKKLKRLSMYKAVKAIPRSPWRNEFPKVLYKRIKGKVLSTIRTNNMVDE